MSDIPPNTTGNSELPPTEQPATPVAGQDTPAPENAPAGRGRVWTPSRRLTAILAAAMLAIGVAVGAAIGPAPDGLLRRLRRAPAAAALADRLGVPQDGGPGRIPARGQRRNGDSVKAPAAQTRRCGCGLRRSCNARLHRRRPGSSTKSKGSSERASTKPLPAVTKVWLVQLNGASFEEALASPSAAPYIDSQAIPSGTFLNSWSALEAQTFASDAALIATTEPQVAQTHHPAPVPGRRRRAPRARAGRPAR